MMRGVRLRPPLSVPLAVLIALTACISQTHISYRGSRAAGMRPASSQWPRPWPPAGITVETDGGTRTHAVLRLYRNPPCGDTSKAELGALAYVSRAPGAKPWVVVLPIWGSSTYPSKKITHRLIAGKQGPRMNVLWIQGTRDLVRYAALEKAATKVEFLAEVARTASCIDATAEDVRGFIDWVMARPDTDPRRVGIVGFSIGGIVGSLVMGRDRRLAAGVFMMVGGHLDEILGYCKWDERKVREHVREAFGWTPEMLQRIVEPPLSIVDPVLVAGSIDPATVLFIDAGYDGCIPRSAREDLWKAMGQPERVTLGYDHKNSFLTMTFLGCNVTTKRIVHFLDHRLGTGERPVAHTAPAPTSGTP